MIVETQTPTDVPGQFNSYMQAPRWVSHPSADERERCGNDTAGEQFAKSPKACLSPTRITDNK